MFGWWCFALIGGAMLGACATQAATERSQGVVEANGISIAYESWGGKDREAILLIAGYGAQLTMWPDELCEELVRRGYRVIRFDNRDVGLSTHLKDLGRPDWQAFGAALQAGEVPSVAYTMTDMADDAVGLLDALGIERAHIVGASMGGIIAQRVAIHHPDRARSLTTIFSHTGRPDMPGMSADLAKLPLPLPPGSDLEQIIDREVLVLKAIGSPAHPTDERVLRERVRRDVMRSYEPYDLERQTAAILADGDRRPLLRRLNVPTVVLHGDADVMVPVANASDTAESIPGAELRIVEGMGHDIPLQLIDTFADAIESAAERASDGNEPRDTQAIDDS